MHPADIQALLKKSGSSQKDIATRIGVTPQAVNRCVHGHIRSKRIAAAISEVTKFPVETLFPGAYLKERAT